jgi:DNA-binding winged helix-turn-helix (wHTH) protein
MIYRFGEFELDLQRVELRLRGAAVELQPVVYQLLCCLVRNRDRVVSKNELLDTVWAGSLVTEASLQRAVSLARTALREGDMQDALRNIPRMGYRFVAEVSEGAAPHQAASSTPAENSALELEKAADAEKWAGHLNRAVEILERAIGLYRENKELQSAARVALRLARIQSERREIAIARGWMALAGKLLQGKPVSRELGLYKWMMAELTLMEGDAAAALRCADEAYAIARELNDDDLEALVLATRGHALMSSGDSVAAAHCHSEAAALVFSCSVSPEHGGYVMCSVITNAVNRGDWSSAAQWTERFIGWCGRFGKSAYPGLCQLHRAEMLHYKGELPDALREVEVAVNILKEAAPWAEGDAYRVLGDVHLAQGDLAAAEQAYQRAYTLGWDPQPGLAWMHFARGNVDTALGSLQRAIASGSWFNRERNALLQGNLVTLAVAADQPELARETLAALLKVDGSVLPMHKALLARARGHLAAYEHQYPQALAFINEARRHWLELGATLDAASEHMTAAKILAAAGDMIAADLELTAAITAFEKAKAEGLRGSCEALRRQWQTAAPVMPGRKSRQPEPVAQRSSGQARTSRAPARQRKA